jgi:hypothetical protein
MATHRLGQKVLSPATMETRYRYNPDVLSLPAMVPSVIPILLLMIPAMLTALSVVREKELGSIINLYVTPVTRTEFLLGKQLPYIVLAMLNFGLMTLLAVTLFGVPVKGSFHQALAAGALLFVMFSTGFGLFTSTFTRSQIAALFFDDHRDDYPCRSVFRPVEPGFFAGRRWRVHRSHLSGDLLSEHHARRVQQSAGLLRPARLFLAAVAGRAGRWWDWPFCC